MASDSIPRLIRLAKAHRWLRRVRNIQFVVTGWAVIELLAVGIYRMDMRPLWVAAVVSAPVAGWLVWVLRSAWGGVLAVAVLTPGFGILPLLLVDRLGRRRLEVAGARVGWWGISDRELELAIERAAD